ncbi:MAG TPA: sulfatase [Bryobacteraceae bacterium]|jgi:N-sulfoglucosamine sulfohydrolase
MPKIPRRQFLAGAAGAAALQAAAAQTGARKRNVLLLIADDLGCFLPSYGDPNAVMPSIERLAGEGVRFSNAYCTTASCSASRSVILSGLYNHANGQYGHAQTEHHFSYLPKITPFPKLLKSAGYSTGYIAKLHVAPEECFGWDLADPMGSRDVWQMSRVAKKFIADAGDKPWYLHCGFHDPHRAGDGFANKQWPNVKRLRLDPAKIKVPSWLPDNELTREDLVDYYEACNRFDQGIGFMLDVLRESGQADNTMVLVMSDHGAPFPNGKTTTYEAGLHVPLIVRCPAVAEHGVTNHALTNWADIMPSILEWTGVKGPDYALHGRSWLPILGGTDPAGWDRVYFSHTFHEVVDYYPMRGVRTREYRYIHNLFHQVQYPQATDLWASRTWQSIRKQGPHAMAGKRSAQAFLHRDPEELYDMRKDPDEVNNLAKSAEHQEILNRFRADTLAFRERTDDFWAKNRMQCGELADPAVSA